MALGRTPIRVPVATTVLHGPTLLNTRSPGPTILVRPVVIGPHVPQAETGEGDGGPTVESRVDVVEEPLRKNRKSSSSYRTQFPLRCTDP